MQETKKNISQLFSSLSPPLYTFSNNCFLRDSQDHTETECKATNVDNIIVCGKIAEYVRLKVGPKAKIADDSKKD